MDDEPRGLVDDRETLVEMDDQRPRAHAEGAGSAGSAGSTNAERTSTTTPAVIATSARLNAGHSGGSRKSVTAPSRTRSARLPSAPPASRPTPIHNRGRAGSVANQPRTKASAPSVTASTSASPASSSNPKATPLLATRERSKPAT